MPQTSSSLHVIILPDRGNSIGIAVLGALIFIGAIALMLWQPDPPSPGPVKLFAVEGDGPYTYYGPLWGMILLVPAIWMMAYAWASLRHQDPLPRIEVSHAGITFLAIYHREFLAWSKIERIDPRQQLGESVLHFLDFHFKPDARESARAPYELDFDCHMPSAWRSVDGLREVADWLETIRTGAAITDPVGLHVRTRVEPMNRPT